MTHPRYFPVLSREVTRLEKILVHGIPACYKDFDEFCIDWFMDFAWVCEANNQQYAELLADQVWCGLAAQVKEARDLDFVAVATRAIADELAIKAQG